MSRPLARQYVSKGLAWLEAEWGEGEVDSLLEAWPWWISQYLAPQHRYSTCACTPAVLQPCNPASCQLHHNLQLHLQGPGAGLLPAGGPQGPVPSRPGSTQDFLQAGAERPRDGPASPIQNRINKVKSRAKPKPKRCLLKQSNLEICVCCQCLQGIKKAGLGEK